MPYAQMFEMHLEIVRGPHDSTMLQKVLPFEPTLQGNATPVYAGMGVHINPAGQWELGASGSELPFFLWAGKDELDVHISGISPLTNKLHYQSHWPSGQATGIFAGGGFEFQTTAFDSDQDYLPNDPLTLTAGGIVTNENAVPYTDLICGFATTHENPEAQQWQADPTPGNPVGTNSHGVEVLTFIGWFMPALPVQN